jgi:L-fuconolactonase
MRIDAHQHFWRYAPDQFPWITPEMRPLQRDFLPQDLGPGLRSVDIDGTIAVQARANADETRFLLKMAAKYTWIRGVVGWVDLCADGVETELARLVTDRKLKGVRHPVQDEPDERFLERRDFQRGLEKLAAFDLVYDLLLHPHHLPGATRLVGDFPAQRFVLDHLGKPDVRNGGLEPWSEHLRALARNPNAHCKLSGLVTQARWNAWKHEDFAPYLDVAYEAFGPDRVLFGSDWPVALVAAKDYAAVHGVIERWAQPLGAAAREKLFGANAARVYRL